MGAMTVEAYGLKYVVDKNAKFIVEEGYEPYIKDVVKLKPGDVFVDVGAHVGKYSFYASRQVEDSGLVIAVEPHPKNVENLKKGIEINGFTNVTVLKKACCNYRGKGFLREYELSAKHELVKKPTKIEVEVDTLDNILQSLDAERLDMVKIDVNGCEYRVLLGASIILMKFKPLLMVEVALEDRESVFKHLGELGYRYTVLCETKRYWDILFSVDK